MSIFNRWGRRSRESGKEETLSTIYSRVHERVSGFEDEEIRYIAAFSGLLGRVAYADLDISDEEISKINKILTKRTSLSKEGVDAVTSVLKHEILALSGLENYLYTREINALASKKQKEEVMLSLFLVAAADRNISAEENEEIRMIAKALGFSHSDFVESRALFKEHLSVLRP